MTESGREKSSRMMNLEILRCIAMMMVVVLHFLGKGGLLGDLTSPDMNGVHYAAWILESFCIVAVNVYMLISGYFLCESSFKPSRLFQLLLQVWMYSVGIGLLAAVTGILPAGEFNTYYMIRLLFPISMEHYWFMTAYVYFYLLLPLLQMAVKRMNKQQHTWVLALLLFAFCILKSILPVRLDLDHKGYDCIWYICVFMVAAYLRKYTVAAKTKRSSILLCYVLSTAAIFGVTCCYRMIYMKTGSLGLLLGVCYEYNHVLNLLAAVCLFLLFAKWEAKKADVTVHGQDKKKQWIVRVSSCTLGVYLLHENLGVRYVWPKWFGAQAVSSVGELLLRTIIAVVVVFVCGIVVEMLRKAVCSGLHRLGMKLGVYSKLMGRIAALDAVLRKEAE